MFKRENNTIRLVVLAILALGLAALWQYSPLSAYLTPSTLQVLGTSIQAHPWGTAALWAAFMGGGLCMLPINILILALSLITTPGHAFLLSLLGSVFIAAAGYGLGYWFGGTSTAPIEAGFRGWLLRRGVFSLVLLRNVPMGPFSAVNMAAGAIGLRFDRFLLATLIGMVPGIAAIVLLGRGLVLGTPLAWAAGGVAILAIAIAGRIMLQKINAP